MSLCELTKPLLLFIMLTLSPSEFEMYLCHYCIQYTTSNGIIIVLPTTLPELVVFYSTSENSSKARFWTKHKNMSCNPLTAEAVYKIKQHCSLLFCSTKYACYINYEERFPTQASFAKADWTKGFYVYSLRFCHRIWLIACFLQIYPSSKSKVLFVKTLFN